MRLALLSAALYTLAFPPWDFGWLAFVALVPLALALRGLSPGRAALVGLLWGVATIWGIGFWVPLSLSNYWGQPSWFGILSAFLGSVAYMGSYAAGFAACAALVSRRLVGMMRVGTLACLWVGWEVARGRLLTGDPWLLLGYALGPYPALVQIADLGAVYLVSFVVAFFNFALAELWAKPSRDHEGAVIGADPPTSKAPPAIASTLIVLSAIYGTYRLQMPLPSTPSVRVRLVQGNNDPGAQWQPALYGQGLDRYLELSRKNLGDPPLDLLIWPESAVTFFPAREPRYLDLIAQTLSSIHSNLLLGAPHYSDRDPAIPEYFNSAFVVSEDGKISGRYDKIHLLPFAEYFPLRTIQFLRRNFERVRSFTPGATPVLLDTPLGKTAVVICFEAIFPELVRQRMIDADVLVNLSNDAWLGVDAGPRQHAQMVAMRAIETRSWVIRATTTGISSIIDPWGRTVAHSQLNVPAVVDGNVVPLRIETVYERFGDVFAFACAGLGAIACVSILLTIF